MADKERGIKIIARNRKAGFEYFLLQKFEAGLVLTGTEVKSLRDGKASLADAYGMIKDGELWIHNLDIPEYSHGNRMNHDPKRRRKLLLNKAEILKLSTKIKERGLTIIPVSLYFKAGWAKIEIALAKGKRLYDKRESMKRKDDRREIDRAVGRRDR